MTITRKSPLTGITRTKEIDVTIDQILAWEMGELVQNAMPHLSADDREFIKTGIEMSKYKLTYDQFKDNWINKPNNMGDVGDLQDITDELNNLLYERDEWHKCSENFAAIIGQPDKSTWATDEEINSAWLFFQKLKKKTK